MKIVLKTIIVIFIIFMLCAGIGMFYISRGLESGSKLVINDVNLALLSDGTYNGTYTAGRWSNEVSVTIKDHKITKVNVVKDVTFPKPNLSEELFNKVIEKQKLTVDTISGATVTCKAYLKSIEQALSK